MKMTPREARQDLNAGDDVCLKVTYAFVPDDFNPTIEFVFRSSDYANDEHKFNKKFFYLIAGCDTWELNKELKAPKIDVKDWNDGNSLQN